MSIRGLPVGLGLAFLALGVGPSPATAVAPAPPALLRDGRAGVPTVPLGNPVFPIDGSHPQPDTQIEPSIAVNPGDPFNAVTAFQEGRVAGGGDADNAFASTHDGGHHLRSPSRRGP